MLETGIVILLCLLMVISIVLFGITVVWLIRVEVKEYKDEKMKMQKCIKENAE